MKPNNTCRVNVIDVKYPPAIGKVEMMSGIRTKEEAVSWAEKNGYATVYFLKSRERVYADKLTRRVDALAKQVETKSGRLAQMAEQGSTLLEYALCAGIVVTALLILGKCGAPW